MFLKCEGFGFEYGNINDYRIDEQGNCIKIKKEIPQ